MSILLSRKFISFATDVFLVLVAAAVAAVCFIPAAAVPASGVSPYYNGDREGNKVSLMFNVYEGEDVVNGILDVLSVYGVKATFFMGGCFADDREELLLRIVSEGHEIGNHGYFHLDHDKISRGKNVEEIENTGKVIQALSGYTPTLFAPPSGAFNAATLSAAESLGYSVVMWSKDTIDWRDADEKKVFLRATDGVRAGDLILMHPKRHTLAALPAVLDYYIEKGLKQTTVSDNLFGEKR
ncbi:MAG: polysaccharide deacetylase family protein [Clostridia bacterium]|nr:polysaccharide deacetylase family protein [Clostridia bacterium]